MDNHECILKLYNTIIENKDNQTLVDENFNKILEYAINNRDKETTIDQLYDYSNELTTYNDLNELQYAIIAIRKLLVQHNISVNITILSNWKKFRDTFANRIIDMKPKNI